MRLHMQNKLFEAFVDPMWKRPAVRKAEGLKIRCLKVEKKGGWSQALRMKSLE